MLKFSSKLQPRVVYLTGGMGSGKSKARGMFESLGVPCIDADKVAHLLYGDKDSCATLDIAKFFPDAIDKRGYVCRKSLRSIIASDARDNAKLIGIMTPHVMNNLLDWTSSQDYRYVIWESALVVNTIAEISRVLFIDVDPNIQIKRITSRNRDWTQDEIRSVLQQQVPREDRLLLSDDVITNNGTESQLRCAVRAMHNLYLSI